MQTVIIGKNQAGQRFDKFLHKYLPLAGNSFIYKMLRKKNITLNGKKAEGKEILSEGDVVESFFSEETFAKFSGQANCENAKNIKNPINIRSSQDLEDSKRLQYSEFLTAYKTLTGISILYEDEHIVIANKPAGMLTQKADRTDLSLNEWLVGYLLASGGISKEELATFHPSVCNRLDRNTSGIVLCGKSLAGSQGLSRIIKDHSLRKFYRTICVGEIKEDVVVEGIWEKDNKANTVRIRDITVLKEAQEVFAPSIYDGKQEYIRTAFHPIACKNGFTYLEVELFTGKTHQIRAQLAHIGHPIIGDFKYGDRKQNQRFLNGYGLKNHLLHAHHIIFPRDVQAHAQGKTRQESQAHLEKEVLKEVLGSTFTAPCPELFEKIMVIFSGNRANS